MRLGGPRNITDTHVAWRHQSGVPNKPTPLLVPDLLYYVSDKGGVLKDRAAFFRRGRSGAGREELSAAGAARYAARAADLAPPDLLDWLHRPPLGAAGSGA